MKLILSGLCLLLAGCAPMFGSGQVVTRTVVSPGPYCAMSRTICTGKTDKLEDETAKQIEGANILRQQLIKGGKCQPRPEDVCKQPKPTS